MNNKKTAPDKAPLTSVLVEDSGPRNATSYAEAAEYPSMKDRRADRATPALDIGNSLLVIGHSSPPSRSAISHE
jgi:hypothetical protein